MLKTSSSLTRASLLSLTLALGLSACSHDCVTVPLQPQPRAVIPRPDPALMAPVPPPENYSERAQLDMSMWQRRLADSLVK